MLMVESNAGLSPMLDALAVLYGYKKDGELAEAMSENGYPVSQQSVSNYKHDRKPPLKFIVGFIRTLGLEGEQRRQLLRAYMDANPEYEDFLRLWAEPA